MYTKRVACNEAKLADGQTYSPAVVELATDGRVGKVYRLEGEIAHTLWIGGKIDIRPDSEGSLRAYKENKEIK